MIDLTKEKNETGRISFANWSNIDIPLIPVKQLDHGSIMGKPSDELVDMVYKALQVDNVQALIQWYVDANNHTSKYQGSLEQWQQFVIKASDERGDPISDYYVQIQGTRKDDNTEELYDFDINVHTYGSDPSLRNFHVNLSDLKPESLKNLSLKVIASSGSPLVTYHGFAGGTETNDNTGKWHATLDLTSLLGDKTVKLFYPFTTTLIELRINREPLPLIGTNKVCWFDKLY